MRQECESLFMDTILNENVSNLKEYIFKINKRLAQCDYFFGAIRKVSESSKIGSKIFEATKRLIYGKKYNNGIEIVELELDNIAIVYANKVIELRNIYVTKGLDFVDSSLIPIILNHFYSLLNWATDTLKVLDDTLVKMQKQCYKRLIFTKKIMEELSNELIMIEGIVKSFNEASDEIFNFSIERDFSKLYESEKDYIKDVEASSNPNGKYKDAVIHNCNVELGLLGISDYKGTKYPLVTSEVEFIYTNKVTAFNVKKREELKTKYEKFPYILSALLNHLDDYENCMADLFEMLDLDKIERAYSRLARFDETLEIVDALGKYIALYNLEWDLESIKNELVTLGLETKFEELIQKIQSGNYKYYIEYCHDRNFDNSLSLYEQLIENKDFNSMQKKMEKEK